MSFTRTFLLTLLYLSVVVCMTTTSTVTVAGVDITVSGTNVTVPSHVTADAAGLSVLPLASAALLACALTSLEIGDIYVESSGPEYQETASNTWSLFNSFTKPTCVVYPRTTKHVQSVMGNIFLMGANYAVQAGAHSAMVGWNRYTGKFIRFVNPSNPRSSDSITDGILISFAHMNSTTYSPSSDTITVLPGVHWGDAADAVEQYGVSAIGGRAR